MAEKEMIAIFEANIKDITKKMSTATKSVEDAADKMERGMKEAQNSIERSMKKMADSAQRSTDRVERAIGEIRRSLSSLPDGKEIDVRIDSSKIKRNIKKALAGMSPASVPVTAAAIGGAGALSSSLAAMAGGVGAFAVAAMGHISNFQNTAEADMSAAQSAFSDNLSTMKSAWGDFLTATEQPVFEAFADGLMVAETLLKEITPIVDPISDSLSTLLRQLNSFAQTDKFQSFIDFFANRGSEALYNWGQIAGNTFKGFMDLMIAFSPLAQSIEEGLIGMTEGFADWAGGLQGTEAFENFLTYVQNNGQVVIGLIGNIFSVLGALSQILAPLGEALLGVIDNVTGLVNALLNGDPIGGFLAGLQEGIPKIIQMGVDLVLSLLQGFVSALPQILSTVVAIIPKILNTLMSALPQIISAGVQILMSLVQGIIQALPMLLSAVVTLVSKIGNALIENLPLLIQAGMQLLMALVTGIITYLPQLIQAAFTVIQRLVDTLMQNLPFILQMGIQILNSLIDGIIQMLPSLIQSAITLILTIVDAIIGALPQIIDAGIEILHSLIDGIIQVLPQLISAALELIFAIVDTLITSLPEIISAGIELLGALVEGIVGALPELWGIVKNDLIGGLLDRLGDIDLWEIGKNIISGLIDGFKSLDIPTPHFSMSGSLDLNPVGGMSLPSIDVSWYETGGIFTGASVIGVGENGDEAVVPLSNKSRMRPFAEAVANMLPQSNGQSQEVNINMADLLQYATINIGGHEAKGTIEFITREQERKSNRQRSFRG